MANWSNEAEAREQIKALVAEYYHDFKEKKADFKPCLLYTSDAADD